MHRGRRPILTGVQLTLRAGEIVRVSGANGSGKSSLLRVLGGLARPRAGRVIRHGSCAYVPEKVVLASAVRTAEWLDAMRRIRGLPAREWTSELTQSGLAPSVLSAHSSTLSKGMLQRVALIDAVCSQCAILLLDEPFAGLDGPGRDWLQRRVTDHAAAGGTVVITDHADAAQQWRADARRLVIQGGRCVAVPARARSAGVRIQARDPAGGTVTRWVEASSSDEVLLELLAAGWHIEQVSR